MDEKRNGCEVCFHDFDHQERRPRVIPCGHTFCSKCVCDNFQENLLLCPICKKEHHAETAANFPVNFRLESILLEGISMPSTPDEISSPATDQPQAISKKLKSMRTELCSGMENKATNNKEVRSTLQKYENLLNSGEGLHHQIFEKYLAIAKQNVDIIHIHRKERARIAETLKEEEQETQRMKIVTDKLHAATTSQEVLLFIKDATLCCEFLERWNRETRKKFSDTQLQKESQVLIQQSQILLQLLPYNSGEAEVEEPTGHLSENMASPSLHGMEASTEFPNENDSIEELSPMNPLEKVTRELENASFSEQTKTPVEDIEEKSGQRETKEEVPEHVREELIQAELNPTIFNESLRMKSGLVMELMKQKRVFAVQEFEGRRRYARMSLHEKKRILLHYLKDQNIPSNAHLFQHTDVLQFNNESRLVFLELWSFEKKQTLGKLFIRLFPNGQRTEQFSLLCSGQNGPSYVESNIVKVWSNGNNNEFVRCGDYEKLSGYGGRMLVHDNMRRGISSQKWSAGMICGYQSCTPDLTAAQFLIFTRDNRKETLDCCFGMVEEGLPILRDAIDNHEDISTVIISDAGLVLHE